MPKVFDDIKIDREFAALIPALCDDERKQLEQNIVEHGGARDPLVVWSAKGELTLIDGHNRYEICSRLGLPFDIHEMRFATRDEAADWIDRNQLGRRNLSKQDYKLLLGRRYNRAKKAEGAQKGNANAAAKQPGQNAPVERTSEKLAREHGVDEKTVRRAGQFQAAASKLGIEKQIASGKVKATEAAVVKAASSLPAKPTREQVTKAVAEVVADRPKRRASKPAVEVFKQYPPTRCLEAVEFYAGEFLDRCPSRAGELRLALVDLITSCDSVELGSYYKKKGRSS